MKKEKLPKEKKAVEIAADAGFGETTPRGWFASLKVEWRRLSRNEKWMAIILMAFNLPLLLAVFSTMFANFDVNCPPYQHMGMVARIIDGLPVYLGPSSEHSTVSYAPLYWYSVAWLSKIFGLSFPLARMVCFACAVAVWILLFSFVWCNTKRDMLLSLTAPTILLSMSALLHFWPLDINVNAMHFAFVIGGFFCLREPLSTRKVLMASILLALGTLAKQTGLAYVVAAAFLVLISSPRRLLLFIIPATVIIASAFFIWQAINDGMFWAMIGTANSGVPWWGNRIIPEILLLSFCGYTGIMFFMTIVNLVFDWKINIFQMARQPHYVMLASGILVACIAHPKYGSGNMHDIIAIASFAVCGCIGLGRVAAAFEPRKACQLKVTLALSQLVIILLASWELWPRNFIYSEDRARYNDIASIFKSGRTCLFGVPYIQRVFGQPVSGIPDDELSKFINGRLDYSKLPDFYVKPFRDEVFDYVIISEYFDPSHPACKAILEHYPTMIAHFPALKPPVGFLRHELYVLRAKRLDQTAPAYQPITLPPNAQ